MDNINFIEKYLSESLAVKVALQNDEQLLSNIETVAQWILDSYRNGGKVLIAGNGGSAGDAQHISAEFVSRFFYDRPGLPAIALTTDTSALTAIGNDYGYERLFSRQVQALGQPGDIFLGISTSGNSPNILEAVEQATKSGLRSVGLCGRSGKLSSMVDLALCAPSTSTPHVQECHIVIGHIICAIVERSMFPRDSE